MTETPLHDWLTPRLDELLAEAGAAGFEREAVLAVLTDLATSATYNTAPLPAEPDAPQNQWPSATERFGDYAEAIRPEDTHGQWHPTPPHAIDRPL